MKSVMYIYAIYGIHRVYMYRCRVCIMYHIHSVYSDNIVYSVYNIV